MPSLPNVQRRYKEKSTCSHAAVITNKKKSVQQDKEGVVQKKEKEGEKNKRRRSVGEYAEPRLWSWKHAKPQCLVEVATRPSVLF